MDDVVIYRRIIIVTQEHDAASGIGEYNSAARSTTLRWWAFWSVGYYVDMRLGYRRAVAVYVVEVNHGVKNKGVVFTLNHKIWPWSSPR